MANEIDIGRIVLAIRVTLLVGMAILVATVGAGCGGEGNGPVRTLPPSWMEFAKRANVACAQERDGLGERASTFLNGQSPGKPHRTLIADLAHLVLLPTIEAQIWRIEGLAQEFGIPSGDEKKIDAMLNAQRHAIDEVATTLRIASIEAVSRHFTEAGKLLRAYGLSACANDLQARGRDG
jgi:hypothetical protein